MSHRSRTEIVKECFRAYETGERDLVERHLADDFEFFAPPDPGIDRDTYFERCWPNAENLSSCEFVRLAEIGDEVVATVQITREDGTRFRNTEIHTFAGDKVVRAEVYFGWDLD